MTLKDNVKQRLAELGRGPTQAERAGGLSKGFVSDILSGKKRSITLDQIPKLAVGLDLSVGDLSALIGQPIGGTTKPANLQMIEPIDLPRNLPVVGVAAGSLVGAFVMDGVIDWMRRPPGLTHASNAYGLFVVGTSMAPKFEPGDLVFVNPDRPPAIGDTVIIQTKNWDGDTTQAWIKTLVRLTDELVIASQINPPSTIEYDRKVIVAIHRVMRNAELFGV